MRVRHLEFDSNGNVRTSWTHGYPDALRDENRNAPGPGGLPAPLSRGRQMIAEGASLEQVAKATERSPAQAKLLFRAELRQREDVAATAG